MGHSAAFRHPFMRVTLVSAVAVVVGSFLPWASVLNGAISKNGLDGDGVLTLILAIAGGVLVASALGRRWMLVVGLVCAALIAVIGFVDLADVNGSDIGDVIDVKPGIGLWVVLIAGVVMTVAAALVLAKRDAVWPSTSADAASQVPPAT